ncbi:MAG: SDR family oxidoreductase [Anaerolineae bacterium]|nr:SDR family oxidoreductase [Anaerolineae bacterium]
MLIDLKEKVVFVTGSARRVGKAIALEFARQGANLVVHHSSSDQSAAQTAAEIRALGVEVLVVKGDYTRPDEVETNFSAVREHYGRLDVMVNSASIFESTPLLEISPEEWQKVMDVNVSSAFWCTQQAGRLMIENKTPGCIINIADNGGRRPWKNRPHHSVSKAALIMLTQVTARALAEHQIRANCVVPGPVLPSPDMSEAYWKKVENRLPLKRSGDPSDVARAAVFLATNDFITGAVLSVDGGEFLGDATHD